MPSLNRIDRAKLRRWATGPLLATAACCLPLLAYAQTGHEEFMAAYEAGHALGRLLFPAIGIAAIIFVLFRAISARRRKRNDQQTPD
jgi:hypothetical protein